jgi:hypothetical protein
LREVGSRRRFRRRWSRGSKPAGPGFSAKSKPIDRDRQVVIEVSRDEMEGHAAVLAWSRLRPFRVEPESFQVLRKRTKASIYRFCGVGVGGSSVIVKRSRSLVAVIERTIYEEVLPHLGVTSFCYYGSREDDGDYCWLFLEDVGARRYSVSNLEHSVFAGWWLGWMHASAARVGEVARLGRFCDGGPGCYFGHLRVGRSSILRNLTNPAFIAADVEVLDAVVFLQDRLETEWNRVEEVCAGLLFMLVYGDFRPKNAYLRHDTNKLQLFPID